ncbi:MAG: glycine--tRNA ligase [Candidatus Andersenbacteria bacterium]|nr:glycine--tRNA ligase [bacterium]MDZ4225225.1 glycine--tRNA ligase [Candidatus Andersenbacteria bacterium]
MEKVSLEKIVELCKRRGFVYPGSAIYGGLRNSWDFGPLGVQLKNNLRDAWWKYFVESRRDMVGLDAAILMNPEVWKASHHVDNFNDPMVDCKSCHNRWRADDLIKNILPDRNTDAMTIEEMSVLISADNNIVCPNCGKHDFTEARQFNLLFETSLGTVESNKQIVYLRGELAQSMFVDFKLIMDSMRKSLPFGIAQVGKAFRNEITPGNFIFRTLEFDLMEFEYFVREADWEKYFEMWLGEMQKWVTEEVGIKKENLRLREQATEERAHYSRRTVDIEYASSWGSKEMFGLAYRADYDLKNHAQATGQDLQVTDTKTGEKFYPHVIEPTFGLSRLVLFVLMDAYYEEEVKGDKRVVLKLKPNLAPYQVAVLPLSKKPELIKLAEPLADELAKSLRVDYDETQSIGKRYRRQDEIGTPYCVTVDFDSLEDKQVTVRERDSMEQERINIDKVGGYLTDKLSI